MNAKAALVYGGTVERQPTEATILAPDNPVSAEDSVHDKQALSHPRYQ